MKLNHIYGQLLSAVSNGIKRGIYDVIIFL